VYTAAQAAQGEELFNRECAACHQAAAYTGANFGAKWSGQTLGDIYQHISLAMPPANPGGLTPGAYASVVAFFLSRSGNPAGNQELPADPAALRAISVR
jgi:mono/diheme cytochrome c family protein